jgi:hypothetical protein
MKGAEHIGPPEGVTRTGDTGPDGTGRGALVAVQGHEARAAVTRWRGDARDHGSQAVCQAYIDALRDQPAPA